MFGESDERGISITTTKKGLKIIMTGIRRRMRKRRKRRRRRRRKKEENEEESV